MMAPNANPNLSGVDEGAVTPRLVTPGSPEQRACVPEAAASRKAEKSNCKKTVSLCPILLRGTFPRAGARRSTRPHRAHRRHRQLASDSQGKRSRHCSQKKS